MNEISIHNIGNMVGSHIAKKADIPNKAKILRATERRF